MVVILIWLSLDECGCACQPIQVASTTAEQLEALRKTGLELLSELEKQRAEIDLRIGTVKSEIAAFEIVLKKISPDPALREIASLPTFTTPGSMADAVEIAIGMIRGEFTTSTIKAVIESAFPGWLSDRDPSAISSTVWRLTKSKKIRQVKPGNGRSPALYEKIE